MILSLTDCVRALKKMHIPMLLSAILCGCCVFVYLILKPVHFTAHGVFNAHISQTEAPFLKALEFIGKEDAGFSIDYRALLQSYPVLEGIVQTLGLQATLTEKKFGVRLLEMYYTLKTARAHRTLKEGLPPSRILDPSVSIASASIVPDEHPMLNCEHVDYHSDTTGTLKIHFLDAHTFRVRESKKVLGVGHLDTPFIWTEGQFTLTGKGKKGKKISLHLIPFEPAVASLKKKLKVVKSKENNALIEISYIHRDRRLAAQIVNEAMEQLQKYVGEEGKKKIKKQLLYLQQRQEEAMEQLDSVLRTQMAHFESDIVTGNILTLRKELDFMSSQQSRKWEERLKLKSEMNSLAHILSSQSFVDDQLLEFLRCSKDQAALQTLTIESARSLIAHHQQQLEGMRLDNEAYDFCLKRLSEPNFDCSSLSKILKEDFLKKRFENMHALHHHLVDTKNWTGKEREQLKEELEIEKRSLVQHIHHLQEGTALQENVLKERISTLQHNLLYLLFQSYEEAEQALNDLNRQAAHFPEKWLNEQKIEISTKITTDMMESISKMMEAKNVGYHMDYLMAAPLEKAFPPLFPDDPHLFLGFVLGASGSFLLGIFVLCLHRAWIGPSASYENLISQGKKVIPREESIPNLALALGQAGRVVLIASKQEIPLAFPLSSWMEKRGERVLLFDVNAHPLPEGFSESDRMAYLTSERFMKHLVSLKDSYDRILLLLKHPASKLETKWLVSYADAVVYGVTDETLSELSDLPETTYFYAPEIFVESMTLKALQPRLEKLLKRLSEKHFSSSSAKNVWERFPQEKF